MTDIPYLPQEAVKCVAIGEKYAELLTGPLKKQGVEEVISIPSCGALAEPVNSHADMLLCCTGKGRAVAANEVYEKLAPELEKYGYTVIRGRSVLGREYPHDVPYNAAVCGNIAMHRFDCTDAALIDELKREHYLLKIKQGYGKCSVAPIGKKAALTSDSAIFRLLSEKGFDVFFVDSGGIILDGMSCGLVGGCCGLLGPQKIAFTGVFADPAEMDAAESFLFNHGVEPVYLTDRQVFDIGSIIPIA